MNNMHIYIISPKAREPNTWVAAVIICQAFLYKPHPTMYTYRKHIRGTTRYIKKVIFLIIILEPIWRENTNLYRELIKVVQHYIKRFYNRSRRLYRVSWARALCLWLNTDGEPSSDATTIDLPLVDLDLDSRISILDLDIDWLALLWRTSQALRARRLEYKERMMLKKQVGWTLSNILGIY